MAAKEERRTPALSAGDAELLAPLVARWLLENDYSLDQIANRVEEKIWEGWYIQLGKIALRAILYLVGALGLAITGWLAAVGRLAS